MCPLRSLPTGFAQEPPSDVHGHPGVLSDRRDAFPVQAPVCGVPPVQERVEPMQGAGGQMHDRFKVEREFVALHAHP